MSEEVPLRITQDMLVSRRVDFERRMRQAPPITVAIIALLAAVFALEVAARALASPHTLIAMGALVREAVVAGEYWRMLSATALHGGVEHLVSNAIALFILGMVCEHAYGRRQFVVLYVFSAISGSVLSVLANPGPSVGASGAIFGLQGAAIVLFRRERDRLLVRNRRIGVVMLVWAIYAIASGIVSPFIDNGAHIGGALGGAMLARRLRPVVLEPLSDEQEVRVRRGLWVVGALLVYTVIGLILR